MEAHRSCLLGCPRRRAAAVLVSIALSCAAIASSAMAQVIPFGDTPLISLLGSEQPTYFEGRFHPFGSDIFGPSPDWLRSGDLNSDGNADLAVVATGENCAFVRNEGEAFFTFATNLVDDDVADALFVNLDADSDDEIIVAVNQTIFPLQHRLVFFDRQPGGEPVEVPASEVVLTDVPQLLLSGEFSGDAVPDVVVLDEMGFKIYTGNGTGGLSLQDSLAEGGLAGGRRNSFFVADFNGDTFDDIFWAPISGGVALRKTNAAAGMFLPTETSLAGMDFGAIIPFDYEDDNDLDLVFISRIPLRDTKVAVNDGAGNFAAPVDLPMTGADNDFLPFFVFDSNGDGRDDLLCSDSDPVAGVNGVFILQQDGAAQFTPVQVAQSTTLGLTHGGLFADFSGDGVEDLLSIHLSFVRVLKGTTTGGPLAELPVEAVTFPGAGIEACNLDGDAFDDLAASDGTLLFGKADGTFDRVDLGNAALLAGGVEVVCCHLDGNGLIDLVFAGSDFLQTWLQDPARTFSLMSTVGADAGLIDLVCGDFDGDLNLDVATMHEDPTAAPGSVSIFFGDGNGGLSGKMDFEIPINNVDAPKRIRAGNANGDAQDDLFAFFQDRNASNVVFMGMAPILGNSNRSSLDFGPVASLATQFTNFFPGVPSTGDMNGDGITDFVTGLGTFVLTRNGDGAGGIVSTSKVGLAFPPFPTLITPEFELADISGDGFLDVIARNSSYFQIQESRAQGRLWIRGGAYGNAAAVSFDDLGFGDFNGDGRLDVAGSHSVTTGKRISIFFQRQKSLGDELLAGLSQMFMESPAGAALKNVVLTHRTELQDMIVNTHHDDLIPVLVGLRDEGAPLLNDLMNNGTTGADVTQMLADNLDSLLDILESGASPALANKLDEIHTMVDLTDYVGQPVEFAYLNIRALLFDFLNIQLTGSGFSGDLPTVPQTDFTLEKLDPASDWQTVPGAVVTPNGDITTVRDPAATGTPGGVYRVTVQPQ